jgi:hypothetical protein
MAKLINRKAKRGLSRFDPLARSQSARALALPEHQHRVVRSKKVYDRTPRGAWEWLSDNQE